MNEIDFKFKVIITGKNEVGKSSIIRRYVKNKFSKSYIPTLLSDFTTKDIRYKNKLVRLLIYELAGHQKYEAAQTRHFTGADYICVVASFDDQQSLKDLSDTLGRITSKWCELNGRNGVPVTAVINKVDLVKTLPHSQRALYEYKILVHNLTKGLTPNGFLFTSAKTGDAVDVLFNKIASFLLNNI